MQMTETVWQRPGFRFVADKKAAILEERSGQLLQGE